ncbi:MAG: hypothetical protein FWE29_04045 [Defluviitaleaceae bacterium]|nr:hypothetical protein [Defluviitaleaceae bacterium]
MKHLVVVNPRSFSRECQMTAVSGEIRSFFRDNGGLDNAVHLSRYPRDAIRVIQAYASKTEDIVRVYSVGGDGILHDCLNGVMGLKNMQLAVMPYGTSNSFVRAFGENKKDIFKNISKQVSSLDTAATDVISVSPGNGRGRGGRYALSFCALGAEAYAISKYLDLIRNRPSLANLLVNHLYSAVASLTAFDKSNFCQDYKIIIDDKEYTDTYLGIHISNTGRYGGNMTPVPSAHPADGQLDIILIENIPRVALFPMTRAYTKGKSHKYPKFFKHVQGKSISIRSKKPLSINLDGEVYYDTFVEVNVLPSAVNIVVPSGIKYANSVFEDTL